MASSYTFKPSNLGATEHSNTLHRRCSEPQKAGNAAQALPAAACRSIRKRCAGVAQALLGAAEHWKTLRRRCSQPQKRSKTLEASEENAALAPQSAGSCMLLRSSCAVKAALELPVSLSLSTVLHYSALLCSLHGYAQDHNSIYIYIYICTCICMCLHLCLYVSICMCKLHQRLTRIRCFFDYLC